MAKFDVPFLVVRLKIAKLASDGAKHSTAARRPESKSGKNEDSSRFACLEIALEKLHVLSLPALWSLGYVELNGLTFLQRAEAIALNRGEVDEDILAVRPAEKSEALGVVKPLHCSLFHICLSCSI
jgi:hypothetical protein